MKTYIIKNRAHLINAPLYDKKRRLYRIWHYRVYIEDFCDCVRQDIYYDEKGKKGIYAREDCKKCIGKGTYPIRWRDLG